MADFRRRVTAMALSACWGAIACGSRTGDYLAPGYEDGVGIGSGGDSGSGGVGGVSGMGGDAAATAVTHGVTAVTGSGGAGFSNTVGPSSVVGGAGGSFGFTGVVNSVSVVGSTSTTGFPTTGGIGGASGSCCEASSTPGCNDPDVTACVCSEDAFCCKYLWDGFCVEEVESFGCGVCEGGIGGATSTQSVVTGSGGNFTAVTTTVSATVSTTGEGGAGGAMQSVVTGIGGASSSTTGEGGSGGVAECVAQSQSDCEACLCSDCFQAYGDCVGDFGCPRILQCLDETGCTGLDCYTPDTCQTVIDRFGGLAGASVGYVTGIIECAANAACPCL